MTVPAKQLWLDALVRLLAQRTGLSRVSLRADQFGHITQAPSAMSATLALEASGSNDSLSPQWNDLIDAVTVRETYFFRHPEHFEVVRRYVLPELRERRGVSAFVRAWSAGCASGEEPYSLAILFGEEGMLDRSHILATDLSRAALESVRKAIYRPWSLRGLNPEAIARHFEREGAEHRLRKHLTCHVTLRPLNLAEASYPAIATETTSLQLIFCRNVLMFFDQATVAAVAPRLFAALEPGGWLITGPSDPLLTEYADFELHSPNGVLVHRRPLCEVSEPGSWVPERNVAGLSPSHSVAVANDVRPVSSWPPRPLPAALLPFALHKEALPELPAITAPAAIRAVWNAQGPLKALALCSTALEQQEPALELHYLHGLLLWELRRHPDAISALRRVLYLDRSHALAHFGLASIYESIGDYQAAQRSFLNTAIACDKLAPDSLLPFGDGLRAEGLRSAAEHGLRRLNVRKNEDD